MALCNLQTKTHYRWFSTFGKMSGLLLESYNVVLRQNLFLPVTGLVAARLFSRRLSLWLAFEIIHKPTPYTFNTVNVSLAGLQVLIHIV